MRFALCTLRSLAAVFKRFDKNGDGLLGPSDIEAMMQFIGGGDLRTVFANLDEDQSGAISPV